MNYSTIDKELLCVVATLREFRSMLLGAEIHIHTDHKNILNIGDSSERRLRWISYVDEYGPTLHYIEGPTNVIADTFSRLARRDDVSSASAGKKVTADDVSNLHCETVYYSLSDDPELLESFLALPCMSANRQKNKREKKKIYDDISSHQDRRFNCKKHKRNDWLSSDSLTSLDLLLAKSTKEMEMIVIVISIRILIFMPNLIQIIAISISQETWLRTIP